VDNVAKVKHKIKELNIEDYSSKILYIINDAAAKYKGIIPDDCWHEPYMPKTELEKIRNSKINNIFFNSWSNQHKKIIHTLNKIQPK